MHVDDLVAVRFERGLGIFPLLVEQFLLRAQLVPDAAVLEEILADCVLAGLIIGLGDLAAGGRMRAVPFGLRWAPPPFCFLLQCHAFGLLSSFRHVILLGYETLRPGFCLT